jgi:hypothetical protein
MTARVSRDICFPLPVDVYRKVSRKRAPEWLWKIPVCKVFPVLKPDAAFILLIKLNAVNTFSGINDKAAVLLKSAFRAAGPAVFSRKGRKLIFRWIFCGGDCSDRETVV